MSKLQIFYLLALISLTLSHKCNEEGFSPKNYKECMDVEKEDRTEVCCKKYNKIIFFYNKSILKLFRFSRTKISRTR